MGKGWLLLMKHLIRWGCLLMAWMVCLGGCAGAGTPGTSSAPAAPDTATHGRFDTVGYYAFSANAALNDFYLACGLDTIELLDIGWYYNADDPIFDQYYTGLAAGIEAAQQKGLKVLVILLTNLEQWKGPEAYGNGSGKTFDPADKTMMAERLSYIEHTIEICAKADAFSLFAGDPGGVLGLGVQGGVEYYVEMRRKVQALVKQHAPQAQFNLNLWAMAQYEQACSNPGTVQFWQGETTLARQLIALDDLFGGEMGVEIPGHDYYRALAFTLYRRANAYPEERFPTASDVADLKTKGTQNIWGFSHFLLDELDDGDSAGHRRTELPSFNTRYIYKYLNGMRQAGMTGVIAGCCSLNNLANLYAFARMAADETVTPEQALREYAFLIADDETAPTLFEIFKYLENDANWHQKLPEQDREPLFETTIPSSEQAAELFDTVRIREDGTFPLPEPAASYLNKIGQRILLMMPEYNVSYPLKEGERVYFAFKDAYDVTATPQQGGLLSAVGSCVVMTSKVNAFFLPLDKTADLAHIRAAGGSLHLSIYCPEDMADTAGYLQLSQTVGQMALEETCHFAFPALTPGWNHIEIPIAESTVYVSPLSNWSKVGACRIVLIGSPGDVFYITDVYFE